MIPFSTEVKTKLTVNLILVCCTALCQRFEEEVTLTRNRHINRSAYGRITDNRSSIRQEGVREKSDRSERCYECVDLDTVYFTGSRNDSHAVGLTISVQLHYVDRLEHEYKTINRSVLCEKAKCFCNYPVCEFCALCVDSDRGNSVYDTLCLIGNIIIFAILIYTIDECVLNVLCKSLHSNTNLEVEFVLRISLLTCNINAGKLVHRTLLCIGNGKCFLENLTYVYILGTCNELCVRCGQRSSFSNSRLRRTATDLVDQRSRELEALRCSGLTTNKRGERSSSVALRKEQTAIVQQIMGSHNIRFICSHLVYLSFSLCFVYFLATNASMPLRLPYHQRQ